MFKPPASGTESTATRFGFVQNSPLENLSRRQFEALRLLASGMNNNAISKVMGIRTSSVSNHLLSIYRDMGISEECNQRVTAALIFHGLYRSTEEQAAMFDVLGLASRG